jgi:hypothetical protein
MGREASEQGKAERKGSRKEIEMLIGINKLSDHFGHKFTENSFFYYHPERDPPEVWLTYVGIKERYRGQNLYQRLLERLMSFDNEMRIIIPDPLPYTVDIARGTFGFEYMEVILQVPAPVQPPDQPEGTTLMQQKIVRCLVWPPPK